MTGDNGCGWMNVDEVVVVNALAQVGQSNPLPRALRTFFLLSGVPAYHAWNQRPIIMHPKAYDLAVSTDQTTLGQRWAAADIARP